MGVFGLTSYISEHASDCFQNHMLHDSLVLIDGNSAASLIYSTLTKSNHAFGGDYDSYAHSITRFVKLLQKCNIRPVFIFDGGYETRKLKTVMQRIRMNVIICGQYKYKYRESRTFPLLLRDIFKIVLHDLGVTVIQCDFEADHEIITLARILKCPVISSDSDFYISHIKYIPFTSLVFRTSKFKKKTSKGRYFISCQLFDEVKFLNQLGGLSNKSLLPILSCALGNDYIPTNTFKNFLEMSSVVKFDERIRRIVKWLRTVTSMEDALEQLFSTIPRNYYGVKEKVKQLIDEFNRTSSDLLVHIPVEYIVDTSLVEDLNNVSLHCASETVTDSIIEADDQVNSDLINLSTVSYDVVDETVYYQNDDTQLIQDDGVIIVDEEEYEIPCDDSDSGAEDSTDDGQLCNIVQQNDYVTKPEVKYDADVIYAQKEDESYLTEIPAWLRYKLRLGLISPTILNIVNFQKIFILSQSEDYFSSPSHEVCLPAMQLAVAIILGDVSGVQNVLCHARCKSMQVGVYSITPVLEIPSYGPPPSLKCVQNLDVEVRRNIITEGLKISKTVNLQLYPEEWRLYIITLLYWRQNCLQCTVNGSHIRSLFVCLIYLSIIDRKIGFTRSADELKILRKSSRKSNSLKNTEEASEDKTSNSTVQNEQMNIHSKTCKNVDECLETILEQDCFRAAKVFLPFHHVDQNLLKNRKQFNVKLVHIFAQLQHCMQSIMLLNSVLDFPFVQYKPHLLFSGTFVYNFYSELHSRKLADGYITRTLLAKANSLISLYRHLVYSWEACIALKDKRAKPKAKKSKSRKRKGNSGLDKKDEEMKNDDGDEGYEDPDNIFATLPEE